MVELTIEQKAKAYDKALERAKLVDDPEWLSPREVAEYIFPELKDSDNKRIEIKLIEFFKGYFPDKEWWGNITQKDILTWLENHGEQKSWSKEDEMQLDAAIHLVSSTGHIETANWLKALKDRAQPKQGWSEEDEMMKDAIYSCVDSHYDGLAKTSLLIWIKSLKDRIQPQQGWSEEDEKVIEDVCYYLNRYGNSFNEKNQEIANIVFQVIDKLKSLRPQSHWRPSNEQIKALNSMTRYCDLATSFDAHDQRIVESLLSDLKKLKGK